MNLRLDRLARVIVSRGSDMVRSVRRQTPAANMIGRFVVGHLVARFQSPSSPDGTPHADDSGRAEE